ncbi:hypothetical protein [Streptosporangium sp. NPDC023615]|uniref:hypothetical protein n=1 Tax=Streptosporangium sp. NPDC023615 TaxID=3154794 RepID=UPI00343EB8D8
MVQTTAALLVLASLLSGGTAATGAPQSSPERVRASAQTAAPNLRACYDGKCKLTITKPVRFRVDPQYGFTRISISFNSRAVRARGITEGGFGEVEFGIHGSGTLGGIDIRLVSLSKRKAVLRLSPAR